MIVHIKNKNISEAKKLIDSGVNIHYLNDLALALSASLGLDELFNYLLEHDANPLSVKSRTLKITSQKGQIDLNEQQIQIEKFLFKYENAYATNFLNDIGFSSVQKEWSGINIRYHSYCHLNPRYHRYIKTHYDHIYDLKDWNKIYYPRDTEPKDLKLSTPGLKFEEIYDPKPITFENSIKQASKDRLVSHYKEDNCRKCEYYLICDGFKK